MDKLNLKEWIINKQICRGCGCSTRLYFELINGQRYCSKCIGEPNYTVKNAVGMEVPIWRQVLSMRSREVKSDRINLKENGFDERELEKDYLGIYIVPWWIKTCVLGRQYVRPDGGQGRSLLVFQLVEFMGQVLKEIWNGTELRTEVVIYCQYRSSWFGIH